MGVETPGESGGTAGRQTQDDAQYRITKQGIDGLWELAGAEHRLGTEERVSLTLALTELEHGRSRHSRPCR